MDWMVLNLGELFPLLIIIHSLTCIKFLKTIVSELCWSGRQKPQGAKSKADLIQGINDKSVGRDGNSGRSG